MGTTTVSRTRSSAQRSREVMERLPAPVQRSSNQSTKQSTNNHKPINNQQKTSHQPAINEPANKPTMGNAENWKNVRRTTLTGEFVIKNTTQPETRTYAKCVKAHSRFPKISRWKCLSRAIEDNRCSHIFETSLVNDPIVICPSILLRLFTLTNSLKSNAL